MRVDRRTLLGVGTPLLWNRFFNVAYHGPFFRLRLHRICDRGSLDLATERDAYANLLTGKQHGQSGLARIRPIRTSGDPCASSHECVHPTLIGDRVLSPLSCTGAAAPTR